VKTSSDFYPIAERLLSSTKYKAGKNEMKKLAQNIKLVETRGLSKLNMRLCDGGRKIWDTFAEHNFAVKLLNSHSQDTPIKYEPENGFRRPPDFRVQIGEMMFFIQMKNLSRLARENRIDRYIRKIREIVEESEIGLFYSVDFSEEFAEDKIQPLADEILQIANESVADQQFDFPNDSEPIAHIEIWRPQRNELKHLTLGMAGDMDFVDETGLARDQIRSSLKNAAQAFDWPVNDQTVNLITMDTSNMEDIDLCDAAFGTEHDVIGENRSYWGRDENGFFDTEPYTEKVAAIISLKRKERSPISDYFSSLFVSPYFQNRLDDLKQLLDFNLIVFRNMRPEMGSADFSLDQE
jgi:hypothetical protein